VSIDLLSGSTVTDDIKRMFYPWGEPQGIMLLADPPRIRVFFSGQPALDFEPIDGNRAPIPSAGTVFPMI
jgi:hypothetical protein